MSPVTQIETVDTRNLQWTLMSRDTSNQMTKDSNEEHLIILI